jgi:CHAD domain-containing protein
VVGQHLEIERKFDVDGSFTLPDLGCVPGVASVDEPVEHRLEAAYFDTTDLRLAQARITLRRRTGGFDAGWHLKLPASDRARRELTEPLGPGAESPPTALADPIRGILRGAPTSPVATLHTVRLVTVLRDGDGRPLAEVADDTVSATALAAAPDQPAQALHWREVEVELVDGDEALLGAVGQALVAAGARPSASASKLARVLADRLAAVDGAPGRAPAGAPAGTPGRASHAARPATPTAGDVVLAAVRGQVEALQQADVMLRTDQEDAIHKLRVAGRRLRSILAAFRPVLARPATEPLREELRWLGMQLSDARDGEVALAHLREVVATQPEEVVLGPVAARLQQTALRERQDASDRARETLSDPRYLRLLDALYALLAAPPLADRADEPARRVLRWAVRRTGRRLRRRIEATWRGEGAARAAALHEVRKAAKRVRYTGEVAEPVLGRRIGELVGGMEHVQDVLGERQDTVIAREHCRRIGLAAFAAGENAWTYGRLHGLEEARAERAEAAFWVLEPSLRRLLKRAARKG